MQPAAETVAAIIIRSVALIAFVSDIMETC